MRSILLTAIIGVAIFINSQAQNTSICDSIYFRSGQVVAADIQKVSKDEVSFYYCGDKKEKLLMVKTGKLLKIKYTNGVVKVLSGIKEVPEKSAKISVAEGNKSNKK